MLIGYAIISSMIYFVIDAAGEMAVAYGDLPGGYNAYPAKFIDQSFGFAVAWNYCFQWLTVLSLELVTASMTIKFWTNVNSDIFIGPFYLLTLGISVFGAKGYGHAEMFFNITKIVTIAGFIIMAIITTCGGAGDREFIGARYWINPGAFHNGFKGFCGVFVTATFAFGGTEFVALSAAEQSNPRQAIPKAVKIVCYRILFIFMIALTMVCFLVPYNSPQLLGASNSTVHVSPFVIAASSHGIKVVPHIINTVILLSVLSLASSAVYSSSRVLQSLAVQGFAPQCFTYIDREGRPLYALAVSALAGLFSFIAAYEKQGEVFNWLLSISGLSTVFTFSSICISHIRFRAAMKSQGRSLQELGYRTKAGVYGSYYAATWTVLVLMAQFYISLFPIGASSPSAVEFFQNYLGAVVFLLSYTGHKLYTRNWTVFKRAQDVDLVTDRKIFSIDLTLQEEKEKEEELKNKPLVRKIQSFFC